MPSCHRSRKPNQNPRVVWTFFLLTAILSGCGVKGKPQPPLTDSPIGRGRPSFSKAISDLTKETKQEDEQEDATPNKNQKLPLPESQTE